MKNKENIWAINNSINLKNGKKIFFFKLVLSGI